MVKSKRKILNIFLGVVLFGGMVALFSQNRTFLFAEQSGGSPESGSTSRLITSYDWLVAKASDNYGVNNTGSWSNDWGTNWNRIMISAAWEPDGDLALANVFKSQTFYSGTDDRNQKTGTLDMSLEEYDGYIDRGETHPENASWENTATNVWQDQRTGLYWSNKLADYTNIFPDYPDHGNCPFFALSNRGDYDGGTPACGNAINACGDLSLEAVTDAGLKTDWYLPTQKQLQMAFIDGMWNVAGSTFTTTSYFWSSTEYSNGATRAWRVTLGHGYTNARILRLVASPLGAFAGTDS